MRALLLAAMTMFLAEIALADAGFRNGNEIDVTHYKGWVRVTGCTQGHQTHLCRAADYDPGAFDRFMTSQRVVADRVKLTAFHEDGSKRTKKGKYDSNKSLSKRFNLLVSTVFQRPLLEYGANTVRYELTNKRDVVASGEFEANVNFLGERSCPDMWLSGWGSTCDNAASACNEYFRRVTGCQ